MRVLGVDPGTVTAGWGVVERQGQDFVFLGGGAITTRGFRSLPERLRVIYAGIVDVINRWAPQALSLEKAFLVPGEKSNVQSTLRLGEARGVVLLAAAQAGLAVYEYSPTEIKMAVVGYGRADKEQVQKGVFSLLLRVGRIHVGSARPCAPTLPTSKDATDALAAAICHLQSSSLRERIQDAEVGAKQSLVGSRRHDSFGLRMIRPH
jgi:crossover junction endodeoxyribonuclease RuvC